MPAVPGNHQQPLNHPLNHAVPFLILQTGMSTAFKSRGILKVLCKVRPPAKSVAAILLVAVANVISPSDLILARIRMSYLFLQECPRRDLTFINQRTKRVVHGVLVYSE